MTRSPLRALAGVLLAAAVTGTLLTSALTSPADAASSRPAVGDCHSLTYAEYAQESDSDPRISCDRKHTSRTIAVKDVASKEFRTDDSKYKAALRVCSPALARAIGGSAADRALSAYDLAFFLPTKAQLKAGARWIRCDLVLLGGTRILALPTDESPALADGLTNGVALCAQITKTASRSTACSVKHNYRAQAAIKVSGSKYPARSRFIKIAKARCANATGTQDWYANWPSNKQWSIAKQRHLVCYGADR